MWVSRHTHMSRKASQTDVSQEKSPTIQPGANKANFCHLEKMLHFLFLTRKYSERLRARLRALCYQFNDNWGQVVYLLGLCRMLVPRTLVGIQDRVRGLGLASGCVDFYGSPGRRGPRAMEEQTVRSVDSGTPGRRRRGQVMPRITGCFYLHHQA